VPFAAVLGMALAAQIDKDCARTVDRALQTTPQAFVRIYGGRDMGQWHVYGAALRRRVATDPDIYSEVAQAWREAGHVTLVNVEARSLDFRSDASYCFRPSGTLARVIESSSGAEVRDDEMRYLDERGNVRAHHSQFSSLFPNPGQTLSPDLRPATPTLYLTVRALPFYSFLSP
jgi:hypothetical protein